MSVKEYIKLSRNELYMCMCVQGGEWKEGKESER